MFTLNDYVPALLFALRWDAPAKDDAAKAGDPPPSRARVRARSRGSEPETPDDAAGAGNDDRG